MEQNYKNAVMEALLARRSVRRYQNTGIEKEKLEAVVKAGLYAASGGNHQTSEFIVIVRPQVLSDLTVLVREEFRAMEYVEGAYHNTAVTGAKTNPDYNFLHHAPALVIAAAKNCWPNGMADCACSLENMQLAAYACGLGSCWVNQLHWLTENQRLRRFLEQFGLAGDETIYGSLALGYPVLPLPEAAPRRENRTVYIE